MSNLELSRLEGTGRGLAHTHAGSPTEPKGGAGLPTLVHAGHAEWETGGQHGPEGTPGEPPVWVQSWPVCTLGATADRVGPPVYGSPVLLELLPFCVL